MSTRFQRLKTDPRFRKPKKHETKIQVDPRFQNVFDDEPGKRVAKVDKYGRKISSKGGDGSLRKFYQLPEDGQPKVDYARGEGLIESSSEEESSESDTGGDVILGQDISKPIAVLEEEAEIDLDESQFATLDAEAEKNIARSEKADRKSQNQNQSRNTTTKPTKRIAAVNLDWDHVKATHLFKIFSSQLSVSSTMNNSRDMKNKGDNGSYTRGRILNVRIYPSEFGKKRMAEEDKSGPPAKLFLKKGKEERDSDSDPDPTPDDSDLDEVGRPKKKKLDGEGYDQDALRRYQLERLRYYYAIATFDLEAAAARVYTELDGAELERSANLFDLSYVPEDMEFDQEFRDEATSDTTAYQALNFTTDALRHSNVKLTWDDDDPERTRITRRNLSKKDIEAMDFSAYIASSDEEDEDIPNAKDAQRLRSLLLSGNDENLPEGWGGTSHDKADGMEITFTPGLSGDVNTRGNKKTDNTNNPEFETTLERYQRKEKEKKKAKRAVKEEARKAQNEPAPAIKDDFFGDDNDNHDLTSEVEDNKKSTKSKKKTKSKPTKSDAQDKGNSEAATDAELALLLAGNTNVQHFDMNEIARAERRAEKSGKYKSKQKQKDKEKDRTKDGDKKRKRTEDDGTNGGINNHKSTHEDSFEIDVADPRFKSLHEDHLFAIDPANPHFKKTKSMKKLLQARHRNGDNDVSMSEEHGRKRPRKG